MIYIVVDYKGYHSSKINAVPYKSGMNLKELKNLLEKKGAKVKFIDVSGLLRLNFSKSDLVVYTSSEEPGLQYREYVIDSVNILQLKQVKLFPNSSLILANNNKSFMTMLIDHYFDGEEFHIPSKIVGSETELMKVIREKPLSYPVVAKLPYGAMSKNVFLANSSDELVKIYKKSVFKLSVGERIREIIRNYRYSGYTKNDYFSGRLILQEFLSELVCDYKVLKFSNRFFLFRRNVRKNDFRASGSGQSAYLYGSACEIPDGIFSLTDHIAASLKTNMLSLDFAHHNGQLKLIELQGIHFGTVGHFRSDVLYQKNDKGYVAEQNNLSIEAIYVDCILEQFKT